MKLSQPCMKEMKLMREMKLKNISSLRRWIKKRNAECNLSWTLIFRCCIFLYLVFATLLIIRDHSDDFHGLFSNKSGRNEPESEKTWTAGSLQTSYSLVGENFDCKNFLRNNSFGLSRTVNMIFRPISLNVNHFVALSTYRTSPRGFSVVGESSILERRRLGKPVDYCVWESFGENVPPIQTEAKLHRAFNIHRKTFETVVIECEFLDAIGSDGLGGKLYLAQEKFSINFLAHEEKPAQYCIVDQEPLFETGLCGPPMFGHANAIAIKTWFLYHERVVNFGYYFLYNYKVGLKFQKVLNQYLKLGKASSIEISNWNDYNAWYFHQSTNNNDCLYRSRFYVKWIFYLDFDEFLYIPPSMPLSHVLKASENASYMSLGSVYWNINLCLSQDQNLSPQTYLGRMTWRETQPACAHVKYAKRMPNDLCLMDKGHRKFVANPFKVRVVGVHNPITVLAPPIHWNASVESAWPKIYHFHGILGATKVCRTVFHQNLEDSNMRMKSGNVLDVSFRNLIHKLGVE